MYVLLLTDLKTALQSTLCGHSAVSGQPDLSGQPDVIRHSSDVHPEAERNRQGPGLKNFKRFVIF